MKNLLEKMLSLNDYRPMTHWIEQFLIDQENKVSDHTWTTYARSLELWRLYLDSYYGETYLGELAWEHLEEFLAWWYFRHYLGRSHQETQILLITLENFAYWLKEKNITPENLWQEEAGQLLKQDFQRIFTWLRNKTLGSGAEQDVKRHIALDTGWFVLTQKDGEESIITSLLTDQEYPCEIQGSLKTFLRQGDVFSGYLWRAQGKKAFIDDQSIANLYPRAAQNYLR